MRPNLASLRAAERGPERLLHAEMFYPGPVGYRRPADAGRNHAMPGRVGAEAADRSAARLRGRLAQGRSRRRPVPVTARRPHAETGIARWLYMILRIRARSSSVSLAGSGGTSVPTAIPRVT